jgi:SAM-dependent methyltransferase
MASEENMPSDTAIRSNVQYWQELQSEGYFENHPCYDGIKEAGGEECLGAIARFTTLGPGQSIAVIGCGYGRESLKLSREVGHIYGIDVSDEILDKPGNSSGSMASATLPASSMKPTSRTSRPTLIWFSPSS